MNKHLITALIGVAIVAVLVASYLNGGNRHGDLESWVNERHAEQVRLRSGEVDEFCLKCHAKLADKTQKETLNQYCNACHLQRGVGSVEVEIRE